MNIDTKHHIERVIKDLEKHVNDLKTHLKQPLTEKQKVCFEGAIEEIQTGVGFLNWLLEYPNE